MNLLSSLYLPIPQAFTHSSEVSVGLHTQGHYNTTQDHELSAEHLKSFLLCAHARVKGKCLFSKGKGKSWIFSMQGPSKEGMCIIIVFAQ